MIDTEKLQTYITEGMSLLPDVDEFISHIAFGTYGQCRQRRALHYRVKSDYNNAATAVEHFWHKNDYLAEVAGDMAMTATLAVNCLDAHDEQTHPLFRRCLDYVLVWSSLYAEIAVKALEIER